MYIRVSNGTLALITCSVMKSMSGFPVTTVKVAWSIGERNLEFMRIILAGHSKKLKACD